MQEAGFSHSAFVFANESSVNRIGPVSAQDVPPGSLISFLQKGLQFASLEAHIADDGSELICDSPFTLTKKHVCTAVRKRQRIEEERPKKEKSDKKKKSDAMELDVSGRVSSPAASSAASSSSSASSVSPSSSSSSSASVALPSSAKKKSPDASSMDDGRLAKESVIPASKVLELRGHSSEVFVCAWNPQPGSTLLASGAGDSTARLWGLSDTMGAPLAPARVGDGLGDSVVLAHETTRENCQDVTTVDWNHDGSLLATGSYDGKARVWDRRGALLKTLDMHEGPIFSLKWNAEGSLLLSGSVDRSAIVWDYAQGAVRQKVTAHDAPTLDVDWRDNDTFATCSADMSIRVCQVGQTEPLRTYLGHQGEVNAVRWSPDGELLASCSDDGTGKVWGFKSGSCEANLQEHSREIYTLAWSPTGPGSAHPGRPRTLATASFDSTIKLWDVEASVSLFTLNRHKEPVYSVAFSPDGEFLASGSFDRYLLIWSTRSGELVKSLKGPSGIFELQWNKAGDRIAVCFSNSVVSIVDLRT